MKLRLCAVKYIISVSFHILWEATILLIHFFALTCLFLNEFSSMCLHHDPTENGRKKA